MDNYIILPLATVCIILLCIIGGLLKKERKSSEAVKRIVNDVKDKLAQEMKKYIDSGETITGLYLISAAFSCSRYFPTIHIDYGIDGDEWFFVIMLGNECERISGPITINKVKEND